MEDINRIKMVLFEKKRTAGFEELVNWSKPETDVLVLVGGNYLVCLNKNDFQSFA